VSRTRGRHRANRRHDRVGLPRRIGPTTSRTQDRRLGRTIPGLMATGGRAPDLGSVADSALPARSLGRSSELGARGRPGRLVCSDPTASGTCGPRPPRPLPGPRFGMVN
jgi:hypothetical protein